MLSIANHILRRLYYTHQGINEKGAKVYPHALEKKDMRRVVKTVKKEGFVAPLLDPIAEEENRWKKKQGLYNLLGLGACSGIKYCITPRLIK